MSIALALCAAITPVSAQAIIKDYELNIPRQPLETALKEFASQTGLQVARFSDTVDGSAIVGPLTGKYSTDEALKSLLDESGLTYHLVNDRTIAVTKPSGPVGQKKAEPVETTSAIQERTDSYLRLAQADALTGNDNSTIGHQPNAGEQDQKRIELQEVIVVGSRLGSSQNESPQPVKVIDREYIERSGLTSIAEIINTLPEASVNVPEGQTFAGAGTVRLRGLPSGSTLMLLNGRSLGSSGAQNGAFFDLNNIPSAAVDRIEVLPSGSSAVYGGDALAGVVNIILRKDHQGVGATASYGAADGTDEKQATLSLGNAWANASASILGTYFKRGALLGAEREMTADQDYRRYGGTDLRREMANPGNVYSTNGANLPGLNSPFAALPDTTALLTPQDLQATAGSLNRSSSVTRVMALYPPAERGSVLVMGEYKFADTAEIFSEVLFSKSQVKAFAPPFALNRVRVPGANPFNPFDQDVLVSYEFADSPGSNFETEYFRPLIGVRGQVNTEWDWETAAWVTNERTSQDLWLLNLPAVNAALAATDPAQAFNPFASGPGGVMRFVTPQPQDFTAKASSMDAFLRGTLLQRLRFSIDTVIGATGSRSTLDRVGTAPVSGDRDAYAFFGEARVPMRALRNGKIEEVALLSAALRYDHYSDFGDVVTPQLGFAWKIWPSVSVTASYGETFKPPTLYNLFQPRASTQTTVIDRRRGNENITAELLRGGNQQLDPQSGESWTLGLAFSPARLEGVRASLTYWDLKLRDPVGLYGPQTFVDNEASLQGRILRMQATPEDVAAGRPGRIRTIDGTWLNAGAFRVSGVDASLSAQFSTNSGLLLPAVSISNVHRYDGTVAPFAAPTDRVSVFDDSGFSPRWKGNASVAWERGPWSASLNGRYTGDYRARNYAVGNIWYLDSHLSFDVVSLLDMGRVSPSDFRLSVGVVNMLNKAPDFSGEVPRGYDGSQYDIRGRFWYTRLMVNW